MSTAITVSGVKFTLGKQECLCRIGLKEQLAPNQTDTISGHKNGHYPIWKEVKILNSTHLVSMKLSMKDFTQITSAVVLVELKFLKHACP